VNVLHLASATDPGWADYAVRHLDEILLDQAHLEKKAAAAALRFTFGYREQASFQAPLSRLAREELEHFELVLSQLERRGVAFGAQRPGLYAARLLRVVRAREPERLLDSLLCSALIEARSCERMQVLADALRATDPELSGLYVGLVASEARHHGAYLRLAEECFPESAVRARLAEIAAHEAESIAREPRRPRLHG
jgi:tRNA-(ms[2]io[6]A)-hydroxylase